MGSILINVRRDISLGERMGLTDWIVLVIHKSEVIVRDSDWRLLLLGVMMIVLSRTSQHRSFGI